MAQQPMFGQGQETGRKMQFGVEVNRQPCQNVFCCCELTFQPARSFLCIARPGVDWIVMLHCVYVAQPDKKGLRKLPARSGRAPILTDRHARS